jgi:hypothetical protein
MKIELLKEVCFYPNTPRMCNLQSKCLGSSIPSTWNIVLLLLPCFCVTLPRFGTPIFRIWSATVLLFRSRKIKAHALCCKAEIPGFESIETTDHSNENHDTVLTLHKH